MGALTDWQIEKELGHRITPFSPMQKREGKISYGVSSMGYDARLGYKFKVFTPVNCGVIDPKKFDPGNFIEKDLTPTEWTKHGDHLRCPLCGFISGSIMYHRKDGKNICPIGNEPTHILIPPNGFVLGETIETFDIPRDILCVVLGKSTYARCGIIVNVTPGEPEWVGKWTVEISNTSSLPAKVYVNEGIMQCIFLRADGRNEHTNIAFLDYITRSSAGQQHIMALAHAYDYMRAAQKSGEFTCRTSYKDKAGKYQDQKGVTDPKVDGGK